MFQLTHSCLPSRPVAFDHLLYRFGKTGVGSGPTLTGILVTLLTVTAVVTLTDTMQRSARSALSLRQAACAVASYT